MTGRRFLRLYATVGPLGRLPGAPGTAGSLLGLLLFLSLQSLPRAFHALLLTGVFCLGVRAASAAAQEARESDPPSVIIDEVVGAWLACLFLPVHIASLSAAFLLFRFFDILKPFPIRRLEALPGGWGIMLDDLVAAVYAMGVVGGVSLLLP